MMDNIRDTLAALADDTLAIARLQVEVGFLKLADYDRLSGTLDGLRNTISTLYRNMDDMAAQLNERDLRITKLQEEYNALQARKAGETQASTKDERLALFKKLAPLATQLPALRRAVEDGEDVSAADVLALLGPLDEALADMGFEPIGAAGEEVTFDPTHHRAVGKGARSVEPGDPVRVRYVGYLHEGNVVVKAHVTAVV
jgi:molecular chaperone GrpE (heat shock protein)